MILQRNEALDFALKEIETVLQADEVEVSDYGYSQNSMNARITIENVKDGNKVYDDKVFLVTVNVEYKKTPQSEEKHNVELKTLKVVK